MQETDCLKNAIVVKDAWKTYDGIDYTLRGLNMHVNEGTIYGLLGSSGCGKTTLLNSIIGLIELDAGKIELSIKTRRDVGFMPQGICLYKQLTIGELLNYFGIMYNMSAKELETRIDLMNKILELPDRNRTVLEISGGQARRVSLAIALLHDPKLLILDEPTVGIDPLLRKRIWDFLMDWNRTNGKTVILTTHYIEETKEVDKIGLIREGMMLCEKSPKTLLEEFNTNYLEDVFLQLSVQQELTNDIKSAPPMIQNEVKSPLAQNEFAITYPRMLAELKKNAIRFYRNLPILMSLIGLPSACLLLLYYGIGRDPAGMSLAVVNEEIPELNFCEALDFSYKTGCDRSYISCKFINKMKHSTVDLIDYDKLSDAMDDFVINKKLNGILHFNSAFTHTLNLRIDSDILTTNYAVDNSTVHIYLDPTDKIVSDILRYRLSTSFVEMATEMYRSCNINEQLANIPIKLRNPIFGELKADFRDFMKGGLLVLIQFGLPLVFTPIIIVEEMISGAPGRSIVAGTTVVEILISHAIVHICVQFLQIVLATILTFGILQYPLQNPILSTLLLISEGWIGIALGFALSLCLTSPYLICFTATSTTVLALAIGGLFWPSEGIHAYIKLIFWLSPNGLATNSFRNLSTKSWNLDNKEMYLGFIATLGWICLLTIINVVYVKRNGSKIFTSRSM